ncbi:MAG: 3-methyl-2-oxobutanoate hydroxymethyltransferase [Clostridium sp.]|nr:3-methyl-2-oxobutanoate hydroxymethyltransferase [Clostridium sp.]
MSSYIEENPKKVTTLRLAQMKANGEKIASLTSYDFTIAGIVDRAGVDMILVGDSAANVMAGYPTTLPITLDEMIIYARSVVRAARRAFVVVDMPFGTCQGSPERALDAAVRIMKETGAEGVKIEGGSEIFPAIRMILNAGIPVCAHLGLTPQSVNQFGGYGLRAKDQAEAEKLLSDAKALAEMGCYAIVLEKIPAELARRVTEAVSVPTIGIGAGRSCDGQILVVQDMLGMNSGFKPKFLRHYGNFGEQMTDAVNHYVRDVRDGDFPSDSEQY